MGERKKYVVKATVDFELYRKLWDITKKRYLRPCKKLSTIVREALQEYIERHS